RRTPSRRAAGPENRGRSSWTRHPWSCSFADPRDLDRVVVLAVAPPAALVGLVLVGEAADLGALGLADHPGRHLRRGQILHSGHDVVTVDDEHRREVDLVALGLAQELDVDALALLDPRLLPAA